LKDLELLVITTDLLLQLIQLGLILLFARLILRYQRL